MPFNKLIQEDTDQENKYPGFKLSSSKSDDRIFVGDNGEQIIEVYGERYRAEKNGEPVLRQDIVAVLKKEDTELYDMLQWLDYWNFHGTVRLIKGIYTLIASIILLIINLISQPFFLPLSNWFFTFLGGLALTAIEVALFLVCWRLLRIGFGIVNVWIWIARQRIKNPDKNKAYYKEIFTDLSQAYCQDKARAARIMKKLI